MFPLNSFNLPLPDSCFTPVNIGNYNCFVNCRAVDSVGSECCIAGRTDKHMYLGRPINNMKENVPVYVSCLSLLASLFGIN